MPFRGNKVIPVICVKIMVSSFCTGGFDIWDLATLEGALWFCFPLLPLGCPDTAVDQAEKDEAKSGVGGSAGC